jgi:hypothetical protein
MTQTGQGTTTARPKLDDQAFEAFMRSRRPASPIWSMSGLDGYLTALIIGPKFIDPRQWIPELTGPEALDLPMETTEHRAVQTIVAEYNRISASLAETPKDHRPGSPGSMIRPLIHSTGTSAFCWQQGTRLSFGSPSSEVMPSLAISSHPSASSARQNGKRPARMLLPSPKRSSISGATSCQSAQNRGSKKPAADRLVNTTKRKRENPCTFSLMRC